jgi:uncharacterized alpha/beta hydrolase family protein
LDFSFEGDLNFNAKNPIIDIILEDNTNKDLNKNAQWIRVYLVLVNADHHHNSTYNN